MVSMSVQIILNFSLPIRKVNLYGILIHSFLSRKDRILTNEKEIQLNWTGLKKHICSKLKDIQHIHIAQSQRGFV